MIPAAQAGSIKISPFIVYSSEKANICLA